MAHVAARIGACADALPLALMAHVAARIGACADALPCAARQHLGGRRGDEGEGRPEDRDGDGLAQGRERGLRL